MNTKTTVELDLNELREVVRAAVAAKLEDGWLAMAPTLTKDATGACIGASVRIEPALAVPDKGRGWLSLVIPRPRTAGASQEALPPHGDRSAGLGAMGRTCEAGGDEMSDIFKTVTVEKEQRFGTRDVVATVERWAFLPPFEVVKEEEKDGKITKTVKVHKPDHRTYMWGDIQLDEKQGGTCDYRLADGKIERGASFTSVLSMKGHELCLLVDGDRVPIESLSTANIVQGSARKT